MRKSKKPRKPTPEQLAALARAYQNIDFVPEWKEIRATYSIPEIIEAVKMNAKPKKKGRPETPNRFAILDACAGTKAEGRPYTKLAAKFELTPKQLADLVEKTKAYFALRLKALSTAKGTTKN
jgi:hypothetical protein